LKKNLPPNWAKPRVPLKAERKISSDIFKYTPPSWKMKGLAALPKLKA
jgi:hypothetical protein